MGQGRRPWPPGRLIVTWARASARRVYLPQGSRGCGASLHLRTHRADGGRHLQGCGARSTRGCTWPPLGSLGADGTCTTAVAHVATALRGLLAAPTPETQRPLLAGPLENAPVTTSTVVLVTVYVGPARLVLPCRAVYCTDEATSFGPLAGICPAIPSAVRSPPCQIGRPGRGDLPRRRPFPAQ